MSKANWGFIFIPLVLAIVFWLLRKIFPAPTKVEKPTKKPSPSLKDKKAFQNYDGCLIGLWLFFCLPVTSVILSWLFSRLGTIWYANRFPEATFILTASWAAYLALAIWSSISPSIYIACRALRVIIGNRNYQEWQEYSDYVGNRYYGINWKPLIRPFIIFVILTTILPWYMLIDWYVLFTPDHIVIKPFFSMTRITRQYSDIENIHTAPAWISKHKGDEEIVHNRNYIIQFHNGVKWITQGGGSFPQIYSSPAVLTSEQKAQILQYVSRKAGVPIIEMKVLNPYEP
jgi:hypothetical protein